MQQPKFIRVLDTNKATGVEQVKYINVQNIQTVYQQNDDIIIEMSDYTQLRILNQNIDIFLDRLIL